MSDKVKRYTFDARAGTLTRYAEGAQMILSADGEMVPASDHDAAIAALSAEATAYVDKLVAERHILEARNEALRTILRDLMPLLAECDCIYSDWSHPKQCPCKQARAALADDPPHLRGPIVQAYADTNGLPPDADEKAGPSSVDRGEP